MTQEQLRQEIIKIKEKYYTPISKISMATGVDRSMLSKFINGSLDIPLYPNQEARLEKWLEDRKVDNQY